MTTSCDRIDQTRDYALDELTGPARERVERHIAECEDCAAELDRLRLTATALRILPDREIPQRIAFVSDKVFERSPVTRFFGGFWNSAARLGFASACVLAAALIVSTYHRPAEVKIAAGPTKAEIAQQIAQQVDAAVSKAVATVHADDAKATEAALKASDGKHERQYRSLMIAMEENMTVLEKRLTTATMLASNDSTRYGTGQ